MEVLRRCSLAIAQRLAHLLFQLLRWTVTKTMSVAPLLTNNLDNSKQKTSNLLSPAPPPYSWSLLGKSEGPAPPPSSKISWSFDLAWNPVMVIPVSHIIQYAPLAWLVAIYSYKLESWMGNATCHLQFTMYARYKHIYMQNVPRAFLLLILLCVYIYIWADNKYISMYHPVFTINLNQTSQHKWIQCNCKDISLIVKRNLLVYLWKQHGIIKV